MTEIRFHKMHGCSNDFVIIDNREYNLKFEIETIKLITNRNLGIGCDQLIIIEDSLNYDCLMKIYNKDGGEAGNCGNAARSVAKLLMNQSNQITIETNTSILYARKVKNEIEVNIGHPSFDWRKIIKIEKNYYDIKINEELDSAIILYIGNPHIVFFVNNLDNIDIGKLGPLIENDPIFLNKVNVNFAEIVDKNHINLKTWERGSGITLSCGTGSCATLVAAIKRNLTYNKALITQKGGSLLIELNANNQILMTGKAEYVFSGVIDI